MGLTAPQPPAAVVLASLAAEPDPALERLLGEEAVAALREELAAAARRWAAAVAPQHAYEATSPLMAEAALREHAGPVLLVAADVPGLSERLARAALDDLAAGVEVVWAPTNDGTPFLVAFPRLDPQRLGMLDQGLEVWAGIEAGRGSGLGLLGSERRLVTPADARALAADPLAPESLVRHLRGAVPVRRGA